MDIRNDIYRPEAQRYLQALAQRIQEAFPTSFHTVDDVIKYVNAFKDPKIAELFLDIGEYYNCAKFYACPKCFPSYGSKTCPHCKHKFEMPAFIVLIMVISIIEKLESVKSNGINDWRDFEEWVSDPKIKNEYQQSIKNGQFEDFGKLIDNLKEHYHKDYGSQRKVVSFMKSRMTPDEKRNIIKSIRYYRKAPSLPHPKLIELKSKTVEQIFQDNQRLTFESEEDIKKYVEKNNFKTCWEALPICYDKAKYWKCYVIDYLGHAQGYCRYSRTCSLLSDENKLDNCFKRTVETIYNWRSKFVHEGQLPPVKETGIYGSYVTIDKKKCVVVELTTTDFKPVFERLVKKFFDEFQAAA